MKKILALILSACMVCSIAACSPGDEPDTSTPTTTSTVESTLQATESTEPKSKTPVTIGNLRFNLSDGMRAEKVFEFYYDVTLLDYKSLLSVSLTDISSKRNSSKNFGHSQSKAQSNSSSSEGNKSETALSIAGFTATGETYSEINGNDVLVLHIDVSFSDADYVYDLRFQCNNQDENWEEYLNLFHEVIDSAEYIGDPVPETAPETTELPEDESTSPSTEPPTEKPTEPRGTAGNPYGPGMFKVGKDIPAGEYLFTATNGKAYVCASSDSNQDDIIENENFTYTFFMTVSDGQYLEAKRCKFSAVGDQIVKINEDGSFRAGMYRVGIDIPAGEYKLTTDETNRGYYCIYDSTEIPFDIVNNDNFEESTYVTVSDGQYLITNRCTGSPS